jgi:hypothetical protein
MMLFIVGIVMVVTMVHVMMTAVVSAFRNWFRDVRTYGDKPTFHGDDGHDDGHVIVQGSTIASLE